MPQQYVRRNGDAYALTDLYFPQINLHVEVNEPAHYASTDRIQADALRQLEIEQRTGHTVLTIDCTDDLAALHRQVDYVVWYIQQEVALQRAEGTFAPWYPSYENSPALYRRKGYLDSGENVQLNTIEDICSLFNAPFVKRGFLRPGATNHPKDENLVIWWPAAKKSKWENILLENTIVERHADAVRLAAHVAWALCSGRTQRLVFFRHRDELGYTFYRFKGIYVLDREHTTPEGGVTWRKQADRYNLGN